MEKRSPRTFAFVIGSAFLAATAAHAAGVGSPSKAEFTFKDASGKTQSASIISKFYPKKIRYPVAKIDMIWSSSPDCTPAKRCSAC